MEKKPEDKKVLGRILAFVFAFAMIMGTGPGIFLVNDAGTFRLSGGEPGLRIPALYAWALFWFVVEATCVVLAAVFVWEAPEE